MRRADTIILFTLLLVSLLSATFNVHEVKAGGTIYIRADGSVDPPTANITTMDSVTYTFTDNNYDSIVVERNSIVVDGAGYTLQGAGSGRGIDLSARTNVTIQNAQIKNFTYGIGLYSSVSSSVSGNSITNNSYGIILDSLSNSNSISKNTVTANDYGITLYPSSFNNSVSGNTVINNSEGVYLSSSSSNHISSNTFTNDGLTVWNSYQNVVEDNTVNGKPLVYLEGVTDYSVGDAGQVILVNCTGIRVEHLNLSRTSHGVQLMRTDNSIIAGNTIADNTVYGIRLSRSSGYNSISGNTVTANGYGITLEYYSSSNSLSGNTVTGNGVGIVLFDSCSFNSLSGNNVTANNGTGIGVGYYSSSNSVTGNTITANNYGLHLPYSTNNTISENTITANNEGIWLIHSSSYNGVSNNTIASSHYGISLFDSSNSNSLSDNTIANNVVGIGLDQSASNTFYHNNFIDNGLQVDAYASGYPNVWDDGYPSGGNYWSDYTDADSYKGQHQNETGSDGVWDHPHVIDEDESGQDRYPLTKPYGGPVGDVDGDRDVDIIDIIAMASAYGVKCPDPRYGRLCDVDLDGDIDIFDIVRAAGNYGKSW